MPAYSLAQRTTDGSNAAAAWELIAATGKGFQIKEIGVALAAATATTLGLGRPAAKGITPTTPVLAQAHRTQDIAATATGALAWGTGPTAPTIFLRRFALPAAVGNSFKWTFDKHGLWVPGGASLVLWNLAANAVLDVYVEIEQ